MKWTNVGSQDVIHDDDESVVIWLFEQPNHWWIQQYGQVKTAPLPLNWEFCPL